MNAGEPKSQPSRNQRFHIVQSGRAGWFPYDSQLQLGTEDSSRNKGLALTVADQEESECDEEEVAMLIRRFKKFFRNIRYTN